MQCMSHLPRYANCVRKWDLPTCNIQLDFNKTNFQPEVYVKFTLFTTYWYTRRPIPYKYLPCMYPACVKSSSRNYRRTDICTSINTCTLFYLSWLYAKHKVVYSNQTNRMKQRYNVHIFFKHPDTTRVTVLDNCLRFVEWYIAV